MSLRTRFATVVLLLACSQALQAQPIFEGAIQFTTDAAGNAGGGFRWNTLGGDGIFNLYTTVANSGMGGSFLNPGNTGGPFGMVLTPGSYQFFTFGEPGLTSSYAGLNLFFNGDGANPSISAFAPTNSSSTTPPFPAFSANPGSTFMLGGNPVPGAGTLSFTQGSYTVTLSDYVWSMPTVYNQDRVSGFDSVPSGSMDLVGSFTLTVVSAVPEPATIGLSLVAVGGAIGTYWWRRRRTLQASEAEVVNA